MSAHLSWDSLVVAVVVGGALLYFLRRAWRSLAQARKQQTGCGPNCDCE